MIPREPRREDVRTRSVQGFTTTFYVCCNPPRPNTFVFSAPVEGRYLGWHAAALGYDGFLRWAYDAWPADPVRDARHRLWPAGDCFLVYPGGYSSIRFEKLREGIVDFEKIRILRDVASRSSNGNAHSLMKKLEAHLDGLPAESDYSKRDYDVPKLREAVHKGGQLIETLSDELGLRTGSPAARTDARPADRSDAAARPIISSGNVDMVFPGSPGPQRHRSRRVSRVLAWSPRWRT